VKFAYYKKLGPRQRRIYDRSDAAGIVRVPGAGDLAALIAGLAGGLERDDRRATELAVQRLVETILARVRVQAVTVRVLAVRPSSHSEELHGLYEWGGNRKRPVVTVWMRTSQRRQVVAFRTFLRTLLHEVVHHLDYQLLRLEDSYHTEGFYKRAESLYRQLVPAALAEPAARPAKAEEPQAGAPPARTRSSAGAGKSKPVPARARRPAAPAPAAAAVGPAPAPTPARRRGKPAAEPQPLLPFMS
jgi:hypothetical protein